MFTVHLNQDGLYREQRLSPCRVYLTYMTGIVVEVRNDVPTIDALYFHLVHHVTFTFLPSNVDLKYAAALCSNAACSARHRPIKYLLQRKHRRPRTRSVLWQWSTFNASRFGGRPHNAHLPFCAFSIHTYCRWVIPYFRRRYASFFLVCSDSFNEVSALKS